MNPDQPTSALSAASLLAVLRRRAWVIVLAFVLVTGATIGFSLLQEKQYSASASLLFRDPQLDQKLFGSTFLAESRDPAREAATNVSLVSLEAVAAQTSDKLEGPTGREIDEKVDVTAEGQSDLVSVTATDTDPRFAAKLANTFANEYIGFRQDADRQKIREAQKLVENEIDELESSGASGSEVNSLEQRLDQLTVLASLQTGNAELVQEAQPPQSASSPKLGLNGALGAIVGLLLGLALALLLDRLDRRIRESDEIEEIVGRPVLGVIPQSRALPEEHADVSTLPPGEFEAFRIIRANLRYFNESSHTSSVLITSAEPGDGKTTVAWNLAAAAASAGASVALLEADLRRPALGDRLEVRPSSGLSEILAGVSGVDSAAVQVPITGSQGDGGPLQAVDVIFAGPLPPNPTDLIDSERMEELLRRLEIRYDAVFIDTPPVSAVSDAIPLMTRVGGILVVSRLNRTSRDALGRLTNQLENLKARTLGVVVNGFSARRRGYGYGYGYGYAYSSTPERRERPASGAVTAYPGRQDGEGAEQGGRREQAGSRGAGAVGGGLGRGGSRRGRLGLLSRAQGVELALQLPAPLAGLVQLGSQGLELTALPVGGS